MYHDYKLQLYLLGCLNLLALFFLIGIPTLGPVLLVLLWGGSALQILEQFNQGATTHLKVEVSAEGLRLQAWRDRKTETPEILDTMEIPLNAIESFSLDQSTIHNRMHIRVRYNNHEMAMLCRSQLPLSHQKVKAEYIIKKLQAAVDIYQRRRKRQLEKAAREENQLP